jgi:chromosome segregation ATPase
MQDEIAKKLEALEGQDEIQGRTLMTLEEGHDSDHRRILDLQTEATELRKNLERSRGDLETEADRIRAIETRMEEAQASERVREEAQSAWMENQGLKIVNFEKDWKTWQTAFEEFQTRADEFGDRISTYEKTYKELMQMKIDLDETIERLERRITEVGEMHRLSEDRSKQDWSSFQSDEMKRWSTFKLTNDEQWREHARLHDNLKEELKSMAADLENELQTLEDIKLTDKLHMQEMMSLIKEWATEIEKAGK